MRLSASISVALIPHYADFYDFQVLPVFGRVTTGEGGNLLLRAAREAAGGIPRDCQENYTARCLTKEPARRPFRKS
jgi:hypothetical protein